MDEVLDSYAVVAKEVQLPDPRWRIAMAVRSAPKTSSGLARASAPSTPGGTKKRRVQVSV